MFGIVEKASFSISVCIKWLLSSGRAKFNVADKPIHVIFALVDHYEPGTRQAAPDVEMSRVDLLLEKYPGLADKHKDANGRVPRRTWFFPPHYHRYGNLKKLVSLCQKGYGEIELHLHHGKRVPDTYDNLRETLLKCIEEYSSFGIFGEEEGEKRYAFIHGDWALANSRDGLYCGVNDELDVLIKTGCYADFTHPSLPMTNPSQINSLFYGTGCPEKPKGYTKGIPAQKGTLNEGLLLVQGPLHPFFCRPGILIPRALGDGICGRPVTTKRRINMWLRTGIHVSGKQNWIFIKTHTHGAIDEHAVLGEEIDSIFSCLEKDYNDGQNFVLHYVTAREMYNLIKAAENIEIGDDPFPYINYRVSEPIYISSVDIDGASPKLSDLVGRTYW